MNISQWLHVNLLWKHAFLRTMEWKVSLFIMAEYLYLIYYHRWATWLQYPRSSTMPWLAWLASRRQPWTHPDDEGRSPSPRICTPYPVRCVHVHVSKYRSHDVQMNKETTWLLQCGIIGCFVRHMYVIIHMLPRRQVNMTTNQFLWKLILSYDLRVKKLMMR
jgi:hypothetical protein